MEIKSTSMNLPADLWRRLKHAATDHDMLIKELVIKFLKEGLDRLERRGGGNA